MPVADSSNKFFVGRRGEDVQITLLRHYAGAREPVCISVEDAVNLAAWLVALADPGGKLFEPLLEEILGT